MTRFLTCLFAATTMASAGLAGAQTPTPRQPGEPMLTVEAARIDLGEIAAGADAVATYTFHNRGGEEVRIIRAKPS
jgi:hypothetical protein